MRTERVRSLDGIESFIVFIADEIGKMECFSRLFVETVRQILDDDVPHVAPSPDKAAASSPKPSSETVSNFSP